MNLSTVQRFIPARLKYRLKPYDRKVFRNRLHLIVFHQSLQLQVLLLSGDHEEQLHGSISEEIGTAS